MNFQQALRAFWNSPAWGLVVIGIWLFSIYEVIKIGADGPIVTAWKNARYYRRNVK